MTDHEFNGLRAINLVTNENHATDKQWFSSDDEMRQYLVGQRAAYADDDGNVIDSYGENLGMWYFITLTTLPNVNWDEALNREVLEDAEPEDMGGFPFPFDGHDPCPDCGDHFCMCGCKIDVVPLDKMTEDQFLDHCKDLCQDHDDFITERDQARDTVASLLGHIDNKLATLAKGIHHDEYPADLVALVMRDMSEDEAEGEAITARFNGPVELTGEELPCVGSDEGCQCEECSNFTEDEKMAQAGMSDDEIAAVNHIDRIQDELNKARTCIGNLLAKLDDAISTEMHWYGNTPSWYVEAAAICCGVNLEDKNPSDWREQELANAKAFDKANLDAVKKRLDDLSKVPF